MRVLLLLSHLKWILFVARLMSQLSLNNFSFISYFCLKFLSDKYLSYKKFVKCSENSLWKSIKYLSVTKFIAKLEKKLKKRPPIYLILTPEKFIRFQHLVDLIRIPIPTPGRANPDPDTSQT